MAAPACTSTRSPGRTGPTSGRVDGLGAGRGAHGRAERRRLATTSASRPSSEQVMQRRALAHRRSGVEQAGMLEAHVGELPQHVVQQHEAAVVRGASPAPSSTHSTWSAAPAAGRSPAPIQIVETPQAARAHRATDTTAATSAVLTSDQDVAGAHPRPAGPRPGRRVVDRDRRQGALAHDHRVHELDRDVARVLGPVRARGTTSWRRRRSAGRGRARRGPGRRRGPSP